jgi:hypothetical protein
MKVQIQFNEDEQVSLADLVEAEVYEDSSKKLFMFVFDIEDKMYLLSLNTLRLTPMEKVPNDIKLIHKQSVGSVTLTR